MTKTQYRPIGMAHTLMHMVVRDVEFVDGQRVKVQATIGEDEANTETVEFHMSIKQALAADIIERVE